MSKKKKPSNFPKPETLHLDDEFVTKTQLLQFLAKQKRPQGWVNIAEGLAVQSKREKKSLSGHLSAMLKSGELLFNRKEQYCLVQQSMLMALVS